MAKAPQSKIRDRIKAFRRVRAGDLAPNPRNWRRHPEAQRKALQGVLEEVGYAGACIAREVRGGKLELIDGHLRQSLDPEQMLPVLVLDVTKAEADKLLATIDPLAGMAEADGEQFAKLMAGVSTNNDELSQMLGEVADAADYDDSTDEALDEDAPAHEIENLEEKWGTAFGQLWSIPAGDGKGEHLLLCGDSTDAASYEKIAHGGGV